MANFYEKDPITGNGTVATNGNPFGQPPAGPNPVTDSALAFGSGAVQGTERLAGLPGDIGNFVLNNPWFSVSKAMSGAGDALGNALGLKPLTPEQKQALHMNPNGNVTFGTEDVANAVHNVTGFTPYQPQTTPGKYAQSVGEFAPMAAMGPGGLLRALTMGAVLPGIGSEAAGEAAGEGSPIEPWARLGGAIVGGALGHGMFGAPTRATPGMPEVTNRVNQLDQAAQDAYTTMRNQGIVVKQDALKTIADDAAAKVTAAGYQPGLVKTTETGDALKILQNLASGDASLDRIDAARKLLREGYKNMSESDQRFNTAIVKSLDEAVNKLGAGEIAGGASPDQAVKALTDARGLYREYATLSDKSGLLDTAYQQAQLKLGANYSQADLNTALRQTLKGLYNKILTDEDTARLFTPAEKDQIYSIVTGSKIEDAARQVGKLAPKSPSIALAEVLGGGAVGGQAGLLHGGLSEGGATEAAMFGLGLPVALMGTGIVGRGISNAMQQGNVNRLMYGLTGESVPRVGADLGWNLNATGPSATWSTVAPAVRAGTAANPQKPRKPNPFE